MIADLNIAEIPYDTGEVRFRYSRVLSDDGTRWIRHGLFLEFDKSGQLVSEGNYFRGMENGLWRDYYPSGQTAAEGHYENGAEVGAWKYWDERGNLTTEPNESLATRAKNE